MPTYAIQELDNPMELITFWDDLVASHYEFAAEPLPSRPERFVSDAQISAGYMHSGYPIMMWLDVVQPREGKLPVLLDLEELSSKGNWGHLKRSSPRCRPRRKPQQLHSKEKRQLTPPTCKVGRDRRGFPYDLVVVAFAMQ